jgi:hypothetical protein
VDITEASVSGRKTRCDCVRKKSVTNGYIFATGSCKSSRLYFVYNFESPPVSRILRENTKMDKLYSVLPNGVTFVKHL